MATVKSAADLASRDREVVDVVGTYRVEDIRPHRMAATAPDGRVVTSFLAVSIRLDDGARVLLGARPDAEIEALRGRRVAARGRLVAAPSRGPDFMAQPDPTPTLAEVERVILAPA